jgi:signal peptidase I
MVAAILCVLAGLFIRHFALSTARVVGGSMEGALKSCDVVLVNRLAYRLGDPARGDIALAYAGGAELIKRVAALPGDSVEIRDGTLYIGGAPAGEDYLSGGAGEDYHITLGPDEYLLLGDNRDHSHDSRAADVGPAKRTGMIGRIVWVLWPIDRFGPAK